MFWGQEQGSPGRTRGLSLSLCLAPQQRNENKCSCSMKTSLRCLGASSGAHNSHFSGPQHTGLLRQSFLPRCYTRQEPFLLYNPSQLQLLPCCRASWQISSREHHLLGLPAAHTHPAHSSALPAAPSWAGRPPPRTSWVWSRPFFRRMCARRFSFFRVMKCTQLCTRRSSISEAWGQQGAVGGSW